MPRRKTKETPRERMKRYYLKRKKKAKRPGPKPPPPVKIEGDPFEAFSHFLAFRPENHKG